MNAEDVARIGADGRPFDGIDVFYVAAQTRVRIIAGDYAILPIEIIEGPARGRRGWVPVEWLK